MSIRKFSRKSIFIRFMLIIGSASLLIHLISGFFFGVHLRSKSKIIFKKSLGSYVQYIIRDLGEDPTFARAKKIAEKNGIAIQYRGDNRFWSTDTKMKELHKVRKRLHPPYEPNKIPPKIRPKYKLLQGWYRGNFYIIADNHKQEFIFRSDFYTYKNQNKGLILMLILISMVMFWAYHSIRKTLHPLKELEKGVEALNKGDFAHQIPVVGANELSNLASSFNTMSGTVKDMLHTRKQLLLDVSHELRSPLTRMKVALEFMDDSKAKKSIQDDVAELDIMLSEILESERLSTDHGKLKKEKININTLMGEVLLIYNSPKSKIIWNKCPGDFVIDVDVDRIKRVIHNVLENALKYSSESTEPIEISCTSDNNTVVLSFKDYGHGIPEEDLPFIFEPFYRVDRSRSRNTGGYGLGMSLCKKIMELHNGDIIIESKENEGTTVKVFFPSVTSK